MSGVGGSEFILLLIIGLIVLGPKRLPEIANTIGGWIGHARRMTRVLKRQLEDELNVDGSRTIRPTPPAQRPTSPPPVDEDPVGHVPGDDDTYSPAHAEESGGDGEDSRKEQQA